MIVRLSTLLMGAVLILATQLTHVAGSSPQEKTDNSSKVVSQETYNRVLDILFPRDDVDSSSGTVFVLVLRFKPSFHPESQVVIRRRFAKVEVLEYTSPDGNIYGQLNQLSARVGKGDAVELAKLIKVKRRAVEVPYSQVKQWHGAFLISVGDSLATFREKNEEYDKAHTLTVALDGTFYDLWYQQGIDEVSFSLYDAEIAEQQPNGEFKLVRWMNAVRRDVEKLK
jgi:hypothetical protein